MIKKNNLVQLGIFFLKFHGLRIKVFLWITTAFFFVLLFQGKCITSYLVEKNLKDIVNALSPD